MASLLNLRNAVFTAVVLLALLPSPIEAKIAITQKYPPDGFIRERGKPLTLSCATNTKWFFCIWKSPGGDKQCAIQESEPLNICTGDKRISLVGQTTNCSLQIRSIEPEDYGMWQCTVNNDNDFETETQFISLEVGQPATVAFDPDRYGGNKRELTITEGEETRITCAATGAHPEPRISWAEPDSIHLDLKDRPRVVRDRYTQTFDVHHTAKYKAKLEDDGAEIRCISTQLDRNGRDIMYENDIVLKLKVEKLVLPVDNALTQKIGIISGVLLAIIFLILLCVFLVFAVCKKRRRKRSRPPSSQESDPNVTPDPPIKPIWTVSQPDQKRLMPDRTSAARLKQRLEFTDLPESPGRTHNGAVGYEDAERQQLSSAPPGVAHRPRSNTSHEGTMSTQSSHTGSWEEERSVGGELGDVAITTQRLMKTPSLHETHFDGGSESDLPRTVLHHPDPYVHQSHQPPMQRHSVGARPSSSADQGAPQYFGYSPYATTDGRGYRPSSAMSHPQSEGGGPVYLQPGRMPTPNGKLTTSGLSVFDCELGCFVQEEDEDSPSGSSSSHTAACGHRRRTPPVDPPPSQDPTSDPRDV